MKEFACKVQIQNFGSSEFLKIYHKEELAEEFGPNFISKPMQNWGIWIQFVAHFFTISVTEDFVMGRLFQEIILLINHNCHLASDYLE